jgi:hypothetical protein
LTEMEGGQGGAEGLSLPRVVIEELRERARRAGIDRRGICAGPPDEGRGPPGGLGEVP